MSDPSIGPRTDRDYAAGFQDAAHLDEARRLQEKNASWVRASMAKRDLDGAAHAAGDAASIPLSPAAFQNPALVRSTPSPPAASGADLCAMAAPTKVVVGAMVRGQELQKAVDFSCVDKNGVCMSKEDLARLEDLRQAACLRTGIDPFRFQSVAPRGAEVREDRARIAADRDMAALQNLERVAQNPFAAAGYSGARLGGASEQTSQDVGKVAGVLGDAAIAIGAGVVGVRAARAPAIARGAVQPLTATEAAEVRTFLVAVKTPTRFVGETMEGLGAGTRVEALAADVHVFRYHGPDGSPRGRWVTEEPVNDAIRELALKRDDNPATRMKEWTVPAGTKVLRGPVAPLNGQPGGGSQIFVPDPSVLREP